MIMKKTALLITLLYFTQSLFAQDNRGFDESQAFDLLPKSKNAVIMPVRKAKVQTKTQLSAVDGQSWVIEKGWEMKEAWKVTESGESPLSSTINTKDWYTAIVPGTVLTTLVEQGVYPDPYFGLNNMAIPDTLCRMDWWYRTEFNMPVDPKGKQFYLLFNGINYGAEIYFNGKLLGNVLGAFIRAEYNVTKLLRNDHPNVLAVHILPPFNPSIPHEQSMRTERGPNGGKLCMDGPTFISSEGWDWVPAIRDRNIGIWQDVRLLMAQKVKIIDPQIITDLPLPDTIKAEITVKTILKNETNANQKFKLIATVDTWSVQKEFELKANETTEVSVKDWMKSPRLWWPNGYGAANLYTMSITIQDENGRVLDSKNVRFGVREFSYELTVDAPESKDLRIEYNPLLIAQKVGVPVIDNINRREREDKVYVSSLKPNTDLSLFTELKDKNCAPFLVIKVNGQRIFCKGGNWGMDDGMKRVSRVRLEPYFRLHKEENFNMIRNWTGENTEEVFYELADEYGLLVWNDFWIGTENANLLPNDNALLLRNMEDVIRRFRNHASIAIWCPRNEGYAMPEIEERISAMTISLDGTRFYQGQSRFLNLRPSGPWGYEKDPSVYFTKICEGFSTEVGTFSLPTAETMRKFIPEADLWPISDTWHYHDFHNGQAFKKDDYLQAISTTFGEPSGVEDICKKAQQLNYDSHRAIFEAFNAKLWDRASGFQLWMSHPAWPSVIWQTYTCDYETHGSFFGSKKACEPVHIQCNLNDNKIIAINNTLKNASNCTVEIAIFNTLGKKLFSKIDKKTLAANSKTEFFTLSNPQNLPMVYLLRLTLKDEKGKIISTNDYWKSTEADGNMKQFNSLGKASLKATLVKKKDLNTKQRVFVLENTSSVIAIGIKLNLRNAKTKQSILPAYFSDGYFNLLPGEKLKITVEADELINSNDWIITSEGYTVDKQTIL